jgi:hypothetical protein
MVSDPTADTPNYSRQGGSEWHIGGTLIADANGIVDFSLATVTLPGTIVPAWGPGAVTLPKISFVGLVLKAAAGVAAAGPVTVAGTTVGQRVIAVIGAPTAGGALAVRVPGTDFEAAVSVAGQIQQLTATDLSGSTYVFLLAPATS